MKDICLLLIELCLSIISNSILQIKIFNGTIAKRATHLFCVILVLGICLFWFASYEYIVLSMITTYLYVTVCIKNIDWKVRVYPLTEIQPQFLLA